MVGADSRDSGPVIPENARDSRLSDETTRKKIRKEADHYLAKRSISGIIIYAILAITVFFFRDRALEQTRILLGFTIAIVLMAASRVYLGYSFERIYARHAVLWHRLFVTGGFLSGTFWAGFSAYFLAIHGIETSSILVVVGSTGLCAGALNTLAPSLLLVRSYFCLILAPVIGLPLYVPGVQSYGLSVMAILYLLFLWAQAGMTHRAYFKGLHDTVLLERRAEELERARQVAVNASFAKSSFLANMSHEIRTPMNGLMGMLDLAMDGKPEPDTRECIEVARSSARSLLRLLDDILDFSKIESGKLSLESIPVNLEEDVATVLKTLTVHAGQKEIELACEIGADVPEVVLGDPGRLRQILLNLVGNAIKFTEEGEVVASIMVALRTSSTAVLQFRVSDSGIGISPEKQKEIFQPFTQADGSTTRRYGGTGLGLTISRSLVEMMGGELQVSSETGSGSTFFWESEFQVPEHQPAGGMPDDVIGLPILVVDDNEVVRRIMHDILAAQGMEVVTVADGAAATESIRQRREAGRPFRLAIIDDSLNEEIQPIFRQMEDSGTGILLATQTAGPNHGNRVPQVATRVLLRKPVLPAELSDAVMDALAPPAAGIQQEAEAGGAAPARCNLRILLAEDNSVNRKVAERMLEQAGHSVLSVENGAEALEAIGKERFDIVLMDIQMPVMDGIEAVRRLRESESGERRLPVLALTAHAMKGDETRFLEAGMDAYVAKPIDRENLLSTIDSVVS